VSLGDNFSAQPLLVSTDVRDHHGTRLSASPRATDPGGGTADALFSAEAADDPAGALFSAEAADDSAGVVLSAADEGTRASLLSAVAPDAGRSAAGVGAAASDPGAEGEEAAEIQDPRSIDPYRAVVEYPELAPLLALAERTDTGWHFAPMHAGGELVAIQGLRTGMGYLDVIRIYGPDRVVVARAWLVGERAGEFLFNREGHPAEVIPALLSLPEPD
jgi:hypothetical protein